MTNPPGASYVVSAYDSVEKVWKTVLSTGDKVQADGMVAAMKQDKVKVRVEMFPPKKG